MYKVLLIGGAFLSLKNITNRLDLHFLPRALLGWLISAAALLLIAAGIISRAKISSASIGYVSSALSFLTALTAGIIAGQTRQGGALYAGGVTATALVICLLTAGFLMKGQDMEPSGILSVVSFSFAGCLFGSVFFSKRKKPSKKSRFRPAKR